MLFASILRQDAEQGGKDTVSAWKAEYLTEQATKYCRKRRSKKKNGSGATLGSLAKKKLKFTKIWKDASFINLSRANTNLIFKYLGRRGRTLNKAKPLSF